MWLREIYGIKYVVVATESIYEWLALNREKMRGTTTSLYAITTFFRQCVKDNNMCMANSEKHVNIKYGRFHAYSNTPLIHGWSDRGLRGLAIVWNTRDA